MLMDHRISLFLSLIHSKLDYIAHFPIVNWKIKSHCIIRMTSINALLAELDCLTNKIAKLGNAGNLLPVAEQAAYRKSKVSEYMKLRTLFRIRRTELVRLLGIPKVTQCQNDSSSEMSSELSEECHPRPRHPIHHKPSRPPLHRPCPPKLPVKCESSSSSVSEDSSVYESGSDRRSCNIYSASDDPLIEDDVDLFGKMGDAVKKFINDNIKPSQVPKLDSESEYDTDVPSVFESESSEADHDNLIVYRLEKIRKRIENHMTGSGSGNFDKVRNLMKDVSKLREEGGGKDTINNHLERIVLELDGIEESCR